MRTKKRSPRIGILKLLGFALLLVPESSQAQNIVATIPSGAPNQAVAVNPVTNKIYVTGAQFCSIFSLNPPGIVTVIDGPTNSTATITAGGCLRAAPMNPVAVNPVTNKIYVASGDVIVIDGATNSTTTIADPDGAEAVAVNPVTNKIYVGNAGTAGSTASVTVIDGATNSTTTVTDPDASGLSAVAIAVNPTRNKIYVANNSIEFSGTHPGNITVIDGATNSITTITDPNAVSPNSVAVNSATNKIYVANGGDYPGVNHGNVTVIDGATNAITTLSDPNAVAPLAVAVNQTTNKIYVANGNDSALSGKGGVSIIDGATNAVSFVSDPNAYLPHAVAVDSVTNTIYVANQGCYHERCSNPGTVTVINGASNSVTTLIDPNALGSFAVTVNQTSDKIYVANGSANITVIDGGATPTSHRLMVALAGAGNGAVTSNPAGVDCGTSCTASFAAATTVSLTASPASGSRLSGWSAACTGANACDLTMTSDEFVMATFGPGADFSLQSASASLTAQRGGQVTDVITIAPLSGGSFDSPIQLTCSAVNPTIASPTCAISPSSVTPGASSVTSMLTITASAQSAGLIPPEGQLSSPLNADFLPIPGVALIGFGLASRNSKQRGRQLSLLCSLFLGFIAIQAGCGGGSSGQQTQPQNFVVVVTGTSAAIQHTAQVTVTVQ
jgi:DNA-binding beta-propeller fold protein YncE